MTKVCKEIWYSGNLQAYCKDFDDTNSSKTTTTDDNYVTCTDCIILTKIENTITNQLQVK